MGFGHESGEESSPFQYNQLQTFFRNLNGVKETFLQIYHFRCMLKLEYEGASEIEKCHPTESEGTPKIGFETVIMSSVDYTAQRLASVSDKDQLCLGLSVYPKNSLFVLRGHLTEVNVVRFLNLEASNHGEPLLASGDANGELKIWSLVSKRSLSSVNIHHDIENPSAMGANGVLNIIPIGDRLITQGRDGYVQAWDLRASYGLASVHSFNSGCLSFCKMSIRRGVERPQIIVSGEDKGVVNTWDLREKKCSLSWDIGAERGMCTCLETLDNEGSHVLCGAEDGSISLWDFRRLDMPLSSTSAHKKPVLSLCIRLGSQGISGSPGSRLTAFSVDTTTKKISRRRKLQLCGDGVSEIASSNWGAFAVAQWSGFIQLYDWRTLRKLASFQYHSNSASTVDFTEALDKSLLATGSRDSRVCVWDVTSVCQ